MPTRCGSLHTLLRWDTAICPARRRCRTLISTQYPKTVPQFLIRLFRDVLPLAREEIQFWSSRAGAIPDATLRQQALASLSQKRFHADGGSVYAAVDPAFTKHLVRAIVAFQTISDYLDNLCDRCATFDARDFHQLHHAMRDAIRPDQTPRPYYLMRGNPDDGGYLADLVMTCQNELANLPGYVTVFSQTAWLVERYCELQEHKHIEPARRQSQLESWWRPYQSAFPDLNWWEFAAATGSTLGVFALWLAATGTPSESDVSVISGVYFPWVCGLHILLDYLIDLNEDQEEGDFNFVQCYDSPQSAQQRIREFARESWRLASQLSVGGRIHRDVVKGLLGMYLSDAKVGQQQQVRPARRLLWEFGPTAWMFYGACRVYRIVR